MHSVHQVGQVQIELGNGLVSLVLFGDPHCQLDLFSCIICGVHSKVGAKDAFESLLKMLPFSPS